MPTAQEQQYGKKTAGPDRIRPSSAWTAVWPRASPCIQRRGESSKIINLKFPQLDKMKKSCQTHCFSTLNHKLGFCYNDTRVVKWVLKQAAPGFQGVSGSSA